MDIIYNGEIYLKKGPEIYNPSADIKEIDEKIEELEDEYTKKKAKRIGKRILTFYTEAK